MSISATINAAFNINSMTYTTNLSIPTGPLTGDAPFTFMVTQSPSLPPEGGTQTQSSLLTVAIGGSNQVYVAVQPPIDTIASVVSSGSGGLVKTLDVIISEGQYDIATKKFT